MRQADSSPVLQEARVVLHADLGRIGYGPAWELQRRLHTLRRQRQVPHVLLTLEHEPVITLGRRAKPEHVLAPPEELRRRGVELFPVERGGDVTYHGPGQLVMYPIVDLKALGLDLHRYVWNLEEVMIRTAQALGVHAFRRPGYPGAWTTRGKLGAVGVHVSGWVTLHGLAFNVDLSFNGFEFIVPCGLHGVRADCLAEALGRPLGLDEVTPRAVETFAQVFEVEVVPVAGEVIRQWTAAPSLRG